MAVIRVFPALLVSLSLLALPGAWAQEEPAAGILTPDPWSLSSDWWDYIDKAGEELPERIDSLLGYTAEVVRLANEKAETVDEDAARYLARLRINLSALPEYRAQSGITAQPAPGAAPEYRIEEYLEIERELRQTEAAAARLRREIDDAQRSAANARQHVDNLLAAYLTLPDGDPARLLRGLQIMAERSAFAIEREEQRVRGENLTVLENRTDQLRVLLDQASNAVMATTEELAAVEARMSALHDEIDSVQSTLRERQANALGARGETPLEQARAAWRRQRVIETEVTERDLQLELARRRLEQTWLSLALAPEEEIEAHLATAQDRLGDFNAMLRETRSELDRWEEQSQRELEALRAVQPEDLEPKVRSMNQRRADTANQTLRNISRTRRSANDAEFVARLTQRRLSTEQGVVVGGFAQLWMWFESAWDRTQNWLGASLFRIGETPVTAFGLLRVALILFVAVWISRLLRHALDRIGSRGEGTQSAFYTVGRLAHYVIIAAAILIGLSSIGLSFANLAIVAGALGVGIGFGLQSIVNNFVSGLILLFERSLKVGDYVELESGVGGVVKEINVRSTLINTNQNLDILVPNSEFVSGRLTNWTLKDASRRMHIPFGVAYGSDKDRVKEAVLDAAQKIPHTVKDNPLKKPDVWLVNFGDSSLDFELIVWVKQASVRRPAIVHAAYTWAIETALGEHGIEIPFPQRDLHLRSGFAAAAAGGTDA